MPRYITLTLECDGLIGPRTCSRKIRYFDFKSEEEASARAVKDGWIIEQDNDSVFCPKCSKPVPSWASPNRDGAA